MTTPAAPRLYEGMFIVDAQVASTTWNKVMEEIQGLILRHGGSPRRIRKWDERKLAYPVRKRARGTYVLAYFDAPTPAIAPLRSELELSEIVIRSLILACERVPKELRKPDEPAAAPPPVPAATA